MLLSILLLLAVIEQPPGTVVLQVTPEKNVIVTWDANTEPDLAGYKLYVGETSRDYIDSSDAPFTTQTTFTWFDLNPDKGDGVYYFAVTAIDDAGNESDFSEEASVSLRDGNVAGPPAAPRDFEVRVIQ